MTATSTPFLVTRGTGEIVRANDAFARLVQVPCTALTNCWRFCQLLSEEAFVNFCEKVVSMYFDTKQHALLTNCEFVPGGIKPVVRDALGQRLQSPMSIIPCNICATVRRDMFNLPILVAITVIPMIDLP